MAKKATKARTPAKPGKAPTRELSGLDILAAPDADDNSPDWRKWSGTKIDSVPRGEIPELDEQRDKLLRTIGEIASEWTDAKQRVYPEHKGRMRDDAAFYARLADRFSVPYLEVRRLPAHVLAGMADAWAARPEGTDAIDEYDAAILSFLNRRPGLRRLVADVVPDYGPQNRKAVAKRLRKLADRTPPLVDYPKDERTGVAILPAGVEALKRTTETTPP